MKTRASDVMITSIRFTVSSSFGSKIAAVYHWHPPCQVKFSDGQTKIFTKCSVFLDKLPFRSYPALRCAKKGRRDERSREGYCQSRRRLADDGIARPQQQARRRGEAPRADSLDR